MEVGLKSFLVLIVTSSNEITGRFNMRGGIVAQILSKSVCFPLSQSVAQVRIFSPTKVDHVVTHGGVQVGLALYLLVLSSHSDQVFKIREDTSYHLLLRECSSYLESHSQLIQSSFYQQLHTMSKWDRVVQILHLSRV